MILAELLLTPFDEPLRQRPSGISIYKPPPLNDYVSSIVTLNKVKSLNSTHVRVCHRNYEQKHLGVILTRSIRLLRGLDESVWGLPTEPMKARRSDLSRFWVMREARAPQHELRCRARNRAGVLQEVCSVAGESRESLGTKQVHPSLQLSNPLIVWLLIATAPPRVGSRLESVSAPETRSAERGFPCLPPGPSFLDGNLSSVEL